MVQFRRRNNAHWYHETQCSGSLEHCSGSPVNISTTVNVPTTVNNENPLLIFGHVIPARVTT